MKQKLEVRCSNIVKTKSDRDVTCGAFLFTWFKGIFSTSCRKCGTIYHASPKADGSLEIHGVPKGEVVLTATNKKEP